MITWPTIRLKEGENPYVTYMKRQVLVKNKCINAIATGETGSGKSWGTLYLLSQADPTFNIDRVFFRASKMLEWIKGEDTLKGKAFMFDEAGVDASATSWWNDINQALKTLYQTGRRKNYISCLTVPYLSDISKGVRKYINTRFEADGYGNNLTKMRGYVVEYNGDMDKWYRKRLLVTYQGGSDYVKQLRLPKATESLLNEYEKKRNAFQKLLEDDLTIKLRKHEDKKIGKPQELTDEEATIYKEALKGLSDQETADLLDLTLITYRNRKIDIKKKGYNIPKPKRESYKSPKSKKESYTSPIPRNMPFLGNIRNTKVHNTP